MYGIVERVATEKNEALCSFPLWVTSKFKQANWSWTTLVCFDGWAKRLWSFLTSSQCDHLPSVLGTISFIVFLACVALDLSLLRPCHDGTNTFLNSPSHARPPVPSPTCRAWRDEPSPLNKSAGCRFIALFCFPSLSLCFAASKYDTRRRWYATWRSRAVTFAVFFVYVCERFWWFGFESVVFCLEKNASSPAHWDMPIN